MANELDWPEGAQEFRERLLLTMGEAFEAGARPFVRYVVVSVSNELRAAFGRIDIARPNDPPPIDSKPKGVVRLLEWSPDPAKFLNRFRHALDGQPFEVNGVRVTGHAFDKKLEAWRRAADREEYGCAWPFIEISTNSINPRPSFRDLIEADGPAITFPGLDDAVRQVSGFTFAPGPGKDLRALRSQVFIWDYRGRISKHQVSENKLTVVVEPPNDDRLKVLGSVTTTVKTVGLVESKPATVERTLDARIVLLRVQLKLDLEVLDEFAEVSSPPRAESASATNPERPLPVEKPAWPSGRRETWSPLGPLGGGGQGLAEKVQRLSPIQVGAMKTLKEKNWSSAEQRAKAVARFRREIEVTSRLSHPFILPVLDGDSNSDEPWVVTEFMPFGSLANHCSVYRGDVLRCFRILRDLAAALAELHGQGLVHRDVKPANVFLRDLDHAVLGDFGIVHDPAGSDLTDTDEVVGAKWFRPPEAEEGRLEEPPPSFDVYSLGKVLWVLLSGAARRFPREAFRDPGFNLIEVLQEPEMEAVNLLLDKMIRATPDERFQSMKDVISNLEVALKSWLALRGEMLPRLPPESAGLSRFLPRLKALAEQVERHILDPKARYFDPARLLGLFTRYEDLRASLLESELLRDLPERKPDVSQTTDNDGRGYILRTQVEALRDDLRYAITAIEESVRLQA